MIGPTKEQTLRALERVSRGEVWFSQPQPNHWQHVHDAASRVVDRQSEAAE